jgi:hypothetical protein
VCEAQKGVCASKERGTAATPAAPIEKGELLAPLLHQPVGAAAGVGALLPRVCLQRCRVCACAARMLCAVCMHWGRPPAELRAGVRWAPKLACGLVRRRAALGRCGGVEGGVPLLAAARGRLGGGGEGEKEG